MRDRDQILLESLYLEMRTDTSRTTESEIKFYFEEIFNNQADELEFIKPSQVYDNGKFTNTIFQFRYKGSVYVQVFAAPGERSSKSDNGSLTVSVFIGKHKGVKNYYKHETNAFYNKEAKSVGYDPILKNAEQVLNYVKSILEEDDRDNDFNYVPTPNKPETKLTPITV